MEDFDKLTNQAVNLDAVIDQEDTVQAATGAPGQEVAVLRPLRDELADILDTVAMGGGFMFAAIPKHYNHEANLKIADAVILLAEKYNYDLRTSLLGENSRVFMWIGLVYAVGAPASGVYFDYLAVKAAKRENEVKGETVNTGAPGEPDLKHNSVVTGAD